MKEHYIRISYATPTEDRRKIIADIEIHKFIERLNLPPLHQNCILRLEVFAKEIESEVESGNIKIRME